jgi:uncharacterized protein
MISESDKAIIISLAKKFDVNTVFLFGSCLDDKMPANDIDLGVKGIAPNQFFNFYGKLLRQLSKPVDVVNLSRPSELTNAIEKVAVKIYEKAH